MSRYKPGQKIKTLADAWSAAAYAWKRSERLVGPDKAAARTHAGLCYFIEWYDYKPYLRDPGSLSIIPPNLAEKMNKVINGTTWPLSIKGDRQRYNFCRRQAWLARKAGL